jgi:ubiquinone/menaquinone biosynthesis C-methylase UbiE
VRHLSADVWGTDLATPVEDAEVEEKDHYKGYAVADCGCGRGDDTVVGERAAW